ncbi:MAG: hypothetical protein II830_00360 [Alphaproteobacteria bacterium]|nr:hypothetical protein [Alphaproteobacteria bacterium]
MILFGSFGSAKAAPKETADFKKNTDTTIVTRNTKVSASSGKFTFNHVKYDAKKMHVEDINVLFMSGNNSAVMYGGNTMKTVEDFGPVLTKISDLQKIIESNPEKYADLVAVIGEYRIRSDEFKNIMVEKYNDENKCCELSRDVVEYYWDSAYQPVFDANAKIGYPEINKENYNNPETFWYVAFVISCLGQSSRQTTGIYKEAMQVAQKQFGDMANLDNFVDASYDICHQRWGG